MTKTKIQIFRPLVSIIIPVFNGARTIEACLNAIYKSEYLNFEVIVVDDGSVDNSIKIAEKFQCKIIKKKQNTGAGESRNIGANLANGEILFFTDSDCIVKTDTVSQIIESFKKGADIVAGTYSRIPLHPENIFSNYQTLFCYYNYLNSSVPLFGTMCAAIKKEVFIKLGGFDTSIRGATVEDLNFQYKIQEIEYKTDVNMNAQVFHDSRNSFSSLIKGYYYRAKYSAKLLLKIKKMSVNKKGYVLNYRTILSYLSLIIFLFFLVLSALNMNFLFLSVFSLIIFLVSRSKFYNQLENKKQLPKLIVIGIVCDIIILFGGLIGILSYMLKKGKAVT